MPAAASPGLVGTSGGFTSLGVRIVRFIPNADAAPAVANIAILTLTFLSGVWFNTDTISAFLRHVADVFPIRALADALQYAFNPYTRAPASRARISWSSPYGWRSGSS